MTNTSNKRLEALLPNGTPRYVRIYDNGGETADRYTCLFTGNYPKSNPTRYLYLGMSTDPTHPQGFGQRGQSETILDREFNKWVPKIGQKCHLGTRIAFEDLPYKCQALVLLDYADIWALTAEQVDTWRKMHSRVVPRKLTEADNENFQMLAIAFKHNSVALVSSIRKSDGADVALVCAMQRNKDDTITPVPFAVMVEGNPYELYVDPTIGENDAKDTTDA